MPRWRPNVSLPVFVIHWNEPARLMATLAGLTLSEGVTIDVSVIDNASRQGVLDEISEGWPDNVRLLRLPVNVGFAGAANEAIARARRAREPWFVIAAHDVLVRASTLAELVACTETDATIGIVGPLLTTADGSELNDSDRINHGEGGGSDPSLDQESRLEALWSANGCKGVCFSSEHRAPRRSVGSGLSCSPTSKKWISAGAPATQDGKWALRRMPWRMSLERRSRPTGISI